MAWSAAYRGYYPHHVADELEKREPTSMRASDADREKVAKVLHEAMGEGRIDLAELDERLISVYAAKTVGELIPLTSDLPVQSPVAAHQPAVRQPSSAPNRFGGTPGSAASIAFMSGVERKGKWTVPATHNAFAMMGGVEIDLSEATFSAAETTINCVSIMGGIEIYVPDDIDVRVDGVGVMGAFENQVGDQHVGDGRPFVRITGFAFMAGIEVKRPKRKRKNKQQELES